MEYKSYGKNGIELKKVDIYGNVCGEFVEFTISYVYENKSKKDTKAVYTFPIPEEAIISGFEVNLGGRLIKGIVEDKKEIEKQYENFVDEGKGYKLTLEELNSEIFKMAIENILPGEKVIIKISYIEDLSYQNSKLKLVIPKVVLPRDIDNQSDYETKQYKLYLNLLVETFEKTKFSCSTHNIKLEEGENNLYKITLLGKNQNLDKDMIIFLEEDIQETCGMVYENYEEDKGIIYLRFKPDIEEDITAKKGKYIFLLDISDSMVGNKFKEAKTALQLCLRNLTKGDTFNIVAMGRELKYFSTESKVAFDEDSLRGATKWIEELQLEEDAVIFEGIKYAFAQEEKALENNIILFTDDIVDDEKEILDYVEENCKESRIFPFGIDTSVNTYFINRIARLTYGKAEFINKNVRIEDVVLTQFRRIRGLQITNINIDWGAMEVEKTYPRTIEYMYDEEPFSIFARIHGSLEGIVTLEGKVGNRNIQRRIVLTKLDLTENADLIEKVWYKKRIESLESRIIYERGEVEEAMRNKIIQLSTDSGLKSDETSFMLIEEIYEPVLGGVVREFLPVKINEVKECNTEKSYYSDDLKELDSIESENIDKSEILRRIATKQLAGGAFAESSEETEEKKIINTAECIFVFTKAVKSVEIYRSILMKAVTYIFDCYEDYLENLELVGTTFIALKAFEARFGLKDNKKEVFSNAIEKLHMILLDNDVEIEEIESKIISDIEEDQHQDQLSKMIYNAIK